METVSKLMQSHFNEMCKSGKLFESSVPGSKIWELYLEKFSPENDPIFRDPESSTHNCNYCKNFVRRYGNIVSIDSNYNIVTIWDINVGDEYKNSFKAISDLLKSSPVENVFFEHASMLSSLGYGSSCDDSRFARLGVSKNVKRYTKEEAEKFGVVKPDQLVTFNHMYLDIPLIFILPRQSVSIEATQGNYRDSKNVFKRGLDEISLDTFTLVKDLINQGSLLDGQTHLHKVQAFETFARQYSKIPENLKDNWCWVHSYKLQTAKFRNELIGTLCSDLSQGVELNEACRTWNKRVDPANYMKATAPITKKQIEEAKKFVDDNGYEESFNRRFATINDIKVSEILHVNSGDGKIPSVSIFDSVKSTSTRHRKSEFEGVEEVSIEKFMTDILPGCTSVEAYLENRLEGNMVSLTTANIKDSKPIFKWSNNYSWTFNGNLAGKSQIKENVKAVGGKISGILRCSLQWNDEDTKGIVDFDLHCKTPFTEIYFSHKKDNISGGWLDVDMINPRSIGIENVTWQTPLKDGSYKFYVRNFSKHTRHTGFKVEIEFGGEVFNYFYNKPFVEDVNIATVTVLRGNMTIEHHLPESLNSKDLYNLPTNQFHKVNLVCLSPNHWENNRVGNKFYFFMLHKCECVNPIRSFHIENLIPELAQHRKVLEVLGNTTMINPSKDQLSGLGFNATVRDQVILRLQGSHKRVIKVKF